MFGVKLEVGEQTIVFLVAFEFLVTSYSNTLSIRSYFQKLSTVPQIAGIFLWFL